MGPSSPGYKASPAAVCSRFRDVGSTRGYVLTDAEDRRSSLQLGVEHIAAFQVTGRSKTRQTVAACLQ